MVVENRVIQQRRDTAANWTSNNPTLAEGEQGYETDTALMKIGDGSTAWTTLNYFFTALAIPGADSGLGYDVSAGLGKYFLAGAGLGYDASFNLNAEHGVRTYAGATDTLLLADAMGLVYATSGSANTATIPPNSSVAYPIGTIIEITQYGAGVTTVKGGTGVTLAGNGGSGSAFSADIQTQYNSAAIRKILINTWLIGGDIDAVAA